MFGHGKCTFSEWLRNRVEWLRFNIVESSESPTREDPLPFFYYRLLEHIYSLYMCCVIIHRSIYNHTHILHECNIYLILNTHWIGVKNQGYAFPYIKARHN